MTVEQQVNAANGRVMDIYLRARPKWVDVKPALEAVSGMSRTLILLPGPPLPTEQITPPIRTSICGASGVGIQHVAAILHGAGTGISQTIGTGGNDLKNEVGGIMMQMGIDVLEADPETRYIALIARRIGDRVQAELLERVARCKKPVVALFMSCTREEVEATGATWARD